MIDSSRYTEKTYVGSGGMASVYKAFDVKLRRHVAIKEMSEQFRDNEEVRNMFINEARKMALVRHQNVVQVYDIFEGEIPTIIMEHMGGGSLATRSGTSSLPPDVVLGIIRQVGSGLCAIHDAGLVHRDIKPENILEENGRYKITDFGVAVTGDEEALPFVTNKYAAPEVLVDPARIGPSSDIYSLGVMAAELLLGPRKFEEAVREAIERDSEVQLPAIKNSVQAFWQQWVASDAELPMLNKIDESIPQGVADFIKKVTHRQRSERILDCRAFLKELDKVIEETGERASAPTEFSPKMKRRLDRSKAEKAQDSGSGKKKKPLWFKLLVGTGVLLLLGVAALFLLPSGARNYYFDVVTDPAGATVLVNGEPVDDGVTPVRIVGTWGDVVTLQLGEDTATELTLADGMEGLSVGDGAYQLEVGLTTPFSINSSEQAANWLREHLQAQWPVNASIPGIEGSPPIQVAIDTLLSFDVESTEAGALLVLHLSADNHATLIYPTPNGMTPRLDAGVTSNLGEELRLVAREPLGHEWILFVVTTDTLAVPEIDGMVPIETSMRTYPIAGAGSPGQELVVWLAGMLEAENTSGTFLEVEITNGGIE